jgi:hypothetical protein
MLMSEPESGLSVIAVPLMAFTAPMRRLTAPGALPCAACAHITAQHPRTKKTWIAPAAQNLSVKNRFVAGIIR